MKTTVHISDALFSQTKRLAKEEHTSMTRLIEEGLQMLLLEKRKSKPIFKMKPLNTQGGGYTPEFEGASWEKIRDEIYTPKKLL